MGTAWESAVERAGTAGLRPVAFTSPPCWGKREEGEDVAGEHFDFSCLHALSFFFFFFPRWRRMGTQGLNSQFTQTGK